MLSRCQFAIASPTSYPDYPNCDTAWFVAGLGSAILIPLWILFLSTPRHLTESNLQQGDGEP